MSRPRFLDGLLLLAAATALPGVFPGDVIVAQQKQPAAGEAASQDGPGSGTEASEKPASEAEDENEADAGTGADDTSEAGAGASEAGASDGGASPGDGAIEDTSAGDAAAATSPDTAGAAEQAQDEPDEVDIPPPPPPRDDTPIELQPYDVELPIVFQPHPKLGPSLRAAIVEELRTILDRDVGVMWNLQIIQPEWLTPRDRRGLERISVQELKRRTVERRYAEAIRDQLSAATEGAFPAEGDAVTALTDELREQVRKVLDSPDEETQKPLIRALVRTIASGYPAAEAQVDDVSEVVSLYLTPAPLRLDKAFPVSVEMQGGSYIVSAREWDRESELLTTVRTRKTIDRRMIATNIARLLAEVFRPVAQIDEADPTSARIRFKAGEFPPADPAFAQASEGSMFIPFFRYLDRNRVLQRIQFLPWSYITVRELGRIRAECDLDTGVRTPLGSFRRRRMDIRALALKPYLDETTLTLVPKGKRTRPLVGYLVAVYDEIPPPPPKPGEKPPEDAPPRPEPDIYRSDRTGSVTIPVDPDTPLQWVYIRSGSALLAKFPLVSGAEQQMTVQCPDDTIRLDVEGQIVLLQSRLIDTIAKQAMVKAMILNRAKGGKWEKVDESLDDLSELPGIEDFEQMVSEIQYPAIKKAQARNDRTSERRIKKLGDQVLKVARIHLDQEKLEEFREDIIQQKRMEDPDADPGRRAAPGQRQGG